MAEPGSASHPAPQAARFPRLRAAARTVARRWPVFGFAGCYQYLHPGRPAATVAAALVFLWLQGLIETYRITITLSRQSEPPVCPRCPRAAGTRLPANSPN